MRGIIWKFVVIDGNYGYLSKKKFTMSRLVVVIWVITIITRSWRIIYGNYQNYAILARNLRGRKDVDPRLYFCDEKR